MQQSPICTAYNRTMSSVIILLVATMAVANAGLIAAPAYATYAAAAPVAHYSPASAVSSSYLHQTHDTPTLAAVHAVHAAPAVVPAVRTLHAAYATAPVAIHAPAIGTSHQTVYRAPGGAQAISTYSKAVDSAFSSVRKYDTRITNDALSFAPVVTAHATPYAHVATPYAQVATPYAHVATPYAHVATPIAAYAAHAPVVTKGYAYSPATVVAHATFDGFGTHYAW